MQGRGVGWLTAEYGMLPASTGDRKARDVSKGRPDGRTVEIQRLIGRSLRAGVDRVALGERQITVDCDVIQADGGTRCAAITGGLSGPAVRYQARLAWLFVFAPAAVALAAPGLSVRQAVKQRQAA